MPLFPATLLNRFGPPYLRRARYTGHVGEDFSVGARHGRASSLRLEEITDLVGLNGRDDAFSLMFSGPSGISSGIHTLHHPALGDFDMLVSPVGPERQPQPYEAIVNRSRRRPWWLRRRLR